MDGATDGHDVTVARLLDINAADAAVAVLGLRREIAGPYHRFTLGALGVFELDGAFVGVTLSAAAPFGHQRITTSGRLWSPRDIAVAHVEVTLASTRRPPSELSIAPDAPLSPAFAGGLDRYHALAQAALDELAEELLYHACAREPA